MTIIPGSAPALRSNLNLSDIPDTDYSVLSSEYGIFYPTSSFKDSQAPLELRCPADFVHYYDPHDSYIWLKLRIRKFVNNEEVDLEETDKIAPSSCFLHALFSTCQVWMNGVPVSRCPQLYSYVGAMQTILMESEEDKKTLLTSELFYRDTVKNTFSSSNTGWNARHELTKTSKVFYCAGRLRSEIFNQIKYLPPGVTISIQLFRNPPSFALTGIEPASVSPFPFTVS